MHEQRILSGVGASTVERMRRITQMPESVKSHVRLAEDGEKEIPALPLQQVQSDSSLTIDAID